MALYSFSVDVPAAPPLVAERLRAVVAPMPTPGRPFVGTVDETSFRLRQDLRYRNSFRPLIRGRIVPTATGSRVHVLMFMHPLSLVFIVGWCGVLFAIESTSLHIQIARSFLPIALLVLGPIVSLGGFFSEVSKVVTELAQAISATTPPVSRRRPGPVIGAFSHFL